MSKKKTVTPMTYKRKDCDRIWIQDIDTGPVLRWKKGTFSDNAYFTDNDLLLLFRLIGRRLGKEFMLVPWENVPADKVPTVDEMPLAGSTSQLDEEAESVIDNHVTLEEVQPRPEVPAIVSDPFGQGQRLPKMLEA